MGCGWAGEMSKPWHLSPSSVHVYKKHDWTCFFHHGMERHSVSHMGWHGHRWGLWDLGTSLGQGRHQGTGLRWFRLRTAKLGPTILGSHVLISISVFEPKLVCGFSQMASVFWDDDPQWPSPKRVRKTATDPGGFPFGIDNPTIGQSSCSKSC